MDVVGENEALRQFFEGQDVHRALENATMDTSMLDEFIESDLELFGALKYSFVSSQMTFFHCLIPLHFNSRQRQLPDSPPDSGSEPCSPPQFKAAYHSTSSLVGVQPSPSFPPARPASKFPCRFLEASSRMNSGGQLCGMHQDCNLKTGNALNPWNNEMPSDRLDLNYFCPPLQPSLSPSIFLMPKKRKHSEILDDPLEYLTWTGNAEDLAGKDSASEMQEYDSDGQNAASVEKCSPSLAWKPYQISPWSSLFNHNYEKL
ncbi:hypothetical protein lerEdw1_020979 [Lerista edwardsae]|nr:hypothetical protein lerEdw1_020979 [Lerista edwardsae]